MMEQLPEAWRNFLGTCLDSEELNKILAGVEVARSKGTVYPPVGSVFRALELTMPDEVRVVLLGQDPYHDEGQAEGLAFSVPDGVRIPPSLRNIFKEYATDLGRAIPNSGSLVPWARGGILLLNSVLTVEAHSPGSHRNLGWESFTDTVVATLSRKRSGLVFLLWGNYALGKKSLISTFRHTIIESPHPSPLSASRGFFGSHPFSRAEQAIGNGWRWPELEA